MPFKHIVDKEKNIVVLKAEGKVSVMDIIKEIQKAISTKRGEGLTRRLIDMSGQDFTYSLEDAQKVLKMMNVSGNVLGSRKIAILFKEIPKSFEFDKLKSVMSTATLDIELFTDKAMAVRFLNKSLKKKRSN